MGRYKQKINEKPSINTGGFVGVIANKSNVTIDNSYIKKGTALINAFDNSNVVIKNCGTPEPTYESNENIVKKTITKLNNEIDRKNLPFFVHHKIARFEDVNLNINDNNSTLSRLEVINEYDLNNNDFSGIISGFRSVIANKTTSNAGINKCDQQFSLENQILKSGNLSTKDVDFTISGLYYLSGLTSSIKAVFPLNSLLGTEIDIPKLTLNYVNREIFPYKNSLNELVYIDGVYKLDSFGNTIDDPYRTEIETAPNTKRYVVSSSINEPIFSNFNLILETDRNNHSIIKFKEDSNASR